MKRYLCFYGYFYYADGGMNDFLSDFNTIEECNLAIAKKHKQNRPDDITWDWAWKQIWDSKDRVFILNTMSE